jgi:hypothetical protein
MSAPPATRPMLYRPRLQPVHINLSSVDTHTAPLRRRQVMAELGNFQIYLAIYTRHETYTLFSSGRLSWLHVADNETTNSPEEASIVTRYVTCGFDGWPFVTLISTDQADPSKSTERSVDGIFTTVMVAIGPGFEHHERPHQALRILPHGIGRLISAWINR